jgi:acetyltransferase-like isoleucine patch superfamily enzyme
MSNLVKILGMLINQAAHSLIRHLYWMYRLSRADLGKHVSIQFPVRVEGSGKLHIGDDCRILSASDLGIGSEGSLGIGHNTLIDHTTVLRVGRGKQLNIGARCTIEQGTKFYVNGVWEIGDDCNIAHDCSIFAREPGMTSSFKVGSGVHIGDGTIIDVCEDVIIGNNVALGPQCILYTHDHVTDDNEQCAWRGSLTVGKIIIEDGAWIGARVTILPGVTIGSGAVIATGSIVNNDIPANAVAGGSPARAFRYRIGNNP